MEETVTIGDTELHIEETDDGFEAVEVGDEPDSTVKFTSNALGTTLEIDAEADFEVKPIDHGPENDFVVGVNEDDVVSRTVLNRRVDDALGGDWDGDWYFNDIDRRDD
jgi:hypothetical protein